MKAEIILQDLSYGTKTKILLEGDSVQIANIIEHLDTMKDMDVL